MAHMEGALKLLIEVDTKNFMVDPGQATVHSHKVYPPILGQAKVESVPPYGYHSYIP